jgi:hypothetical protein
LKASVSMSKGDPLHLVSYYLQKARASVASHFGRHTAFAPS